MDKSYLRQQVRRALGLSVVLGFAASAAQAGVVAYSYLELQNINVTDTSSISIGSVQNSSTSNAGFFGGDGVLRTDSNNSVSGGLDIPQACVGDCGFSQNAFAPTYDVNSTSTFIRGDAILSGGITSTDGADATTMSEAQLGDGTGGIGGQGGSALTNTSEFAFTAQADGSATLEFDILSSLYVQSTTSKGFARANISWSVQLFQEQCDDIFGCNFVDISTTLVPSDPRFQLLANQQISVQGVGSAAFSSSVVEGLAGLDGPYSVTAGLEAGSNYKFEIRQSSLAEAKVPVPATIALLGLGLAAVGFVGRRRKAA